MEAKGYVEQWEKDGLWHVAKKYEPTAEDRRLFWHSYPPGDKGPFYKWQPDGYKTKEEAERHI